jgi:predicted dinucleotide-binding enzyme
MENPQFGDQNALLFCCGDNAEAKTAVHSLTADPGFAPQDAGQDFPFQVIRRN